MIDLALVSYASGWLYTICWSLYLIPQVILNWKTQSVVSLSPEYLLAMLTGYAFYMIYNVIMFTSEAVQVEYAEHHSQHLGAGQTAEVPVKTNDVVYAANGIVLTLILMAQYRLYAESGRRGLSVHVWFVFGSLWALAAATGALALSSMLDMSYFLALVGNAKPIIGLFKYAPQITLNRLRGNVVGWSMKTVALDLAGGVFSLLQLFVGALAIGHSHEILENIPKLLLGVEAVWFNVVILLQTLVLYKKGV